jgi:hypothetical protein
MSRSETAGRVKTAAVAAALDPYRPLLAEDSRDFTVALLALAKANAKGTSAFNQASPQDAAALQSLAHWRRDARHALKQVRAVASGAPGRSLAEKWLKALIAALDLQRQGLSLIDPNLAADAGRLARKRIAESHRLETRLDRVLA